SKDCVRFARRLEETRIRLPEGITAIQEWTRLLRRVLKAMGATHFLPCPDGQSPTPTCPAQPDTPAGFPSAPAQQQKADDVQIMREAIIRHERDNPSA